MIPWRHVSSGLKAVTLTLALTLGSLPLMHADQRTVVADNTSGFLAGLSVGDTLRLLPADALDAQFRDMRDLGVGAVRMDFSWAAVQPAGSQSFVWSDLDRVVDRARTHNMRVLAILAYTPAWARPSGCGSEKCQPADVQQFAAFARAAAERYASRGVVDWEIWNEPNITKFWRPAPDPKSYADLFAAAATAIRQVDQSANILSGGLAAAPPGEGNIQAPEFLDRILDLGAGRFLNTVSYHPYTYPLPASSQNAGAWAQIPEIRDLLTRYGVPASIWITEYGAPTGGPGVANDGDLSGIPDATSHVTERWQAVIATDAVATAAETPAVSALFWYTYRDFDAGDSPEGHYGLYRTDGSPKPARDALKSALQSPGILARREGPVVDR